MSALRLPSCKILVFTFLSLVDLALTLQLLATGNEAIYESNPAARWFFQHYGWAGLAVFKAGLVSLVLCLSMAISLHHPRAGRRILLFACAALVPVVVYNSALASHLTFCPEHAQDALARETWSRGLALTAEIQASREYGALVARLSADLAAGRSGLAEAAQALQSTERAQDPRWLALLHERYPGQSDETCLAANLVTATLGALDGEPRARARALRLAADLRATYGILVLGQDSLPLDLRRKAGHAPALPAPRHFGGL
jgi:Domain of unknown function (DUF5658)